MEDFESVWNRFHPGILPLIYDFHLSGVPTRVRFHSLPRSKRYADSDQDRQVILTRMNALALHVLGKDVPCWMVLADSVHAPPRDNSCGLDILYQRHFDELDWVFRVGLTASKLDQFAALLTEIADDQGPKVLWMSPENGALFCPYDGGADLVLPSWEDVAAAESKFHAWLPSEA